MNTQQMIFFMFLVLVGTIALLAWFAVSGSMIAIILLSVLGTLLLVGVGWGLATMSNTSHQKANNVAAIREQARFIDNAKENISLITATQKAQNLQNQALLRQANVVAGNGRPVLTSGALEFDDGIFEDLD